MFYLSDVVAAQKVVDALARAKVPLKDLREWQSVDRNAFQNGLPRSSLSTLRIGVLKAFLITMTGSWDEPALQCARMLAQLPSLQDICFSTTGDGPEDISDIFDALSDHKQLRRVEFSTACGVCEEDLVKFVEVHTNSLRCLILDGIALIGSWFTILRSIAHATKGGLEYFRAR